MGFILENVPGMMELSKDDREAGLKAPMIRIKDELSDRLGDAWHLDIQFMESHPVHGVISSP